MWSKPYVQVTKLAKYFNIKEDFQMKFVLVCEKYAKAFTEIVQRYLNEGYELRGNTFTTTETYYKTVEYRYNQVLVKNDNDEVKESEDK